MLVECYFYTLYSGPEPGHLISLVKWHALKGLYLISTKKQNITQSLAVTSTLLLSNHVNKSATPTSGGINHNVYVHLSDNKEHQI